MSGVKLSGAIMRLIFAATAAAAAFAAAACAQEAGDFAEPAGPDAALPDGLSQAVFASGCFWCTEADFEPLDGVVEVVSGFAGGEEENPEYYAVVRGETGHAEAARVIYDPSRISYEALLDHYWVNVDPFDGEGQFCDRGASYAPFIFPADEAQSEAARESLSEVEARFGREVAVEIEPLDMFWPAGAEHQDFKENNPVRYSRYRFGCRRDQRLRDVWGEDALGGAP
ncbi:MAG: peptide-methionine (S)-S-oxide reductase MsrA [Oceanicaulis sp.]